MPPKMGDDGQTDTARGGSSAPGYETRDANPNAVLGFLAFLFLVLALILFGTWRLFRLYNVAEQQPAQASSFAGVRQIPSGPELEVNGREDFLNTYAKQQQELETYSWEDRKAGTVRIPIEQAMSLLLQKGLPVVPPGTEDKPSYGKPPRNNAKSKSGAPSSARGGSPDRQ
jgi:hypothetical protein